MKNLKLLVILILVNTGTLLAQIEPSFSHSVGTGISIGDKGGYAYSIRYSPRVNLIKLKDEITLSLGTHAGFWFSSYSYVKNNS